MRISSLWSSTRRRVALIGGASALALTASCSDFLDPKPSDVLTPENFYHSALDAVTAVNAVYSQVSGVYFWLFYETDWTSDDALAANVGDDGHQLASYSFNDNLWSINTAWGDMYKAINRANIVLDRVPPIAMDTVQRNQVLGQARFLRALMYFNLVRMFGDVPVIEHELKTVEEAQVPRTPADSVYKLIINDLQFAANTLPRTWSGNDIGRATSVAAKSLLAKVYLTRGDRDNSQADYQQAANLAADVMTTGGRSLNANFMTNFQVSEEFTNPESIFEVSYGSPKEIPGGGSVVSLFLLPNGFPGGDAYGTTEASPQLVQLYAPSTFDNTGKRLTGDQRGERATYMTSPYWNPQLQDTVRWGGNPAGAAFAKYYDPTDPTNLSARSWQSMPNNWIVLRYADVLLMYAEALNDGATGSAGTAEDALNQVRARAGIPAVAGLSPAALRDSIRLERRRELAFEGQRWFDLSRWGILDSAITAKTTFLMTYRPGEVQSPHGVPSNLFPIPAEQLNLNDKLTQNPGW